MKTNNSPVSDNEKLIVRSKIAVEDVSLKFRVAAWETSSLLTNFRGPTWVIDWIDHARKYHYIP